MQSAILAIALASSLGAAGATPVDFQVVPERPAIAPAKAAAPANGIVTRAKQVRFSTAYGFGKDVPLGFALRQIVPPAVHISVAPGVDMTQTVSWHGGHPWDQVLREAIRPAGLHAHMGFMVVRIV